MNIEYIVEGAFFSYDSENFLLDTISQILQAEKDLACVGWSKSTYKFGVHNKEYQITIKDAEIHQ